MKIKQRSFVQEATPFCGNVVISLPPGCTRYKRSQSQKSSSLEKWIFEETSPQQVSHKTSFKMKIILPSGFTFESSVKVDNSLISDIFLFLVCEEAFLVTRGRILFEVILTKSGPWIIKFQKEMKFAYIINLLPSICLFHLFEKGFLLD